MPPRVAAEPLADAKLGAPPRCSVIVPTYRRPERLAAVLRALAAQDLPRSEFEVLVVDDGGGQPLDAVVDAWRGVLQLSLLTQSHAGPAAARNTGIVAAQGELLAFTDDDCLPDPGWLRALIDAHDAHPDALLGGHTLNALPDNIYSAASQLLIEAVYAYYNVDPLHARFFASNNIAAPAEALRALGGFDAERFPMASEDRDLCARWLESGRGMLYAPAAVVRHAHPLTLASFFRQHLAYGRGAWRFRQALAGRDAHPPAIQSVRFFQHLARYPWQHDRGTAALRMTLLIAVSQLASSLGLAMQALQHARCARAPLLV